MNDAQLPDMLAPDLLALPHNASDRERLIALQFAMAAHIREQRMNNDEARNQRYAQNTAIQTLTTDMTAVKKTLFGAKVTWKTLAWLSAFISGMAALAAWIITALVGFPHIGGK